MFAHAQFNKCLIKKLKLLTLTVLGSPQGLELSEPGIVQMLGNTGVLYCQSVAIAIFALYGILLPSNCKKVSAKPR